MNRKQKKKFIIVICWLATIGVAIGLVLYALKQNINLFYTPSQLLASHTPDTSTVRLGGYVAKKSIHYDANNNDVTFTITDMKNTIIVKYQGVLPNLFREGQGVVVTGHLSGNLFQASQVLAKHDEKYVPWTLKKEL